MKITIQENSSDAGVLAAEEGAELILRAIGAKGFARIILATGVSQFNMLSVLVKQDSIDWSKCTVFHLDEYIGLASTHPASFVNYLNSRFVEQVPNLKHFEAINGENDPQKEIERLNTSIGTQEIDVAFIGIGENGHLAFNDPPADFETTQPYLKVQLDSDCRSQQVSEGWFNSIDEVPTHAISMSIQQILKAKNIICMAPDARKTKAVANAVEGPVTNLCPASILQQHNATHLFLDNASASGLQKNEQS